ncbi:MAG: FAD-dependent oxidoreductase [Saprospiraceae bacterium]|nr:FAD-dependent oxidoreductase [Saprospiraceae bacterium]
MTRKAKTSRLRSLLGLLSKEINETAKNNPDIQYPISRRKFIRQSGGVALGSALAMGMSAAFLQSCKQEAGKNVIAQPLPADAIDVAILGAGMAGLNCANHLLDSGLKFKIYEAQRRNGGRILTHYNDSLQLGIFPEFGGDFIDSDHQEMIDLAKEFDLELIDLIKDQEEKKLEKDIFYFDNRKIGEKELIEEFKKVAPKIASDITSLGENWDTDAAAALDLLPLSDYFEGLSCAPWLKELLTAAYIAEYGLDCDEQSTLNFLAMIDTDTSEGFKVFGVSDERYRVKGGNSAIIQGLTRKIGIDPIENEHEVTEINEEEGGYYTIKFKNEVVVHARHIVCTIPFTILRDIKINLKDISPEKRKCINELGYGMNTKLVLGYNSTPWSNSTNKAMGYLFHKDIVNGWDGSNTKTEGNTKGAYVCYFGGRYSMDLSAVSTKSPMAPPTHVWRTELPKEKIDGFVADLDKVFKGSKKEFLDKHVFVNWIDFPWVKGSYSCYKPGQWFTIAGLEYEPVGNFHFAGEHCSEDYQGFMNGAAETGRRVAKEVMAMAIKAQ